MRTLCKDKGLLCAGMVSAADEGPQLQSSSQTSGLTLHAVNLQRSQLLSWQPLQCQLWRGSKHHHLSTSSTHSQSPCPTLPS